MVIKTDEKKNKKKIERIVLACLMLLSVAAGTYSVAKYSVSKNSNNHTSTPAKFGIDVSVSDADVFAKQYNYDDTSETYSVSADHEVVAPGTSGNLPSFTITDSGREVDVEISVAFTLTYSSDWKILDTDGAVTSESDDQVKYYMPLVVSGADAFTKSSSDSTGVSTFTTTMTKKVSESAAMTYNNMKWTWAYESTNNVNDAADTAMGKKAAGTVTITGSVTVTQIA